MIWKRLDTDNYPEPNSSVFCNKCGQKNRGDHSWVYSDDPTNELVLNVRNKITRISPLLSQDMIKMMGPIAQNFYYCVNCRKQESIKLPRKKYIKEV